MQLAANYQASMTQRGGSVDTLLKARAYQIRDYAQSISNVDTGAYRAAWSAEPSANGWTIKNDQPYAAIVEHGSRPHEIHGRPLLRFVVNGRVVYARKVNHPGTRPYNILKQAIAANRY